MIPIFGDNGIAADFTGDNVILVTYTRETLVTAKAPGERVVWAGLQRTEGAEEEHPRARRNIQPATRWRICCRALVTGRPLRGVEVCGSSNDTRGRLRTQTPATAGSFVGEATGEWGVELCLDAGPAWSRRRIEMNCETATGESGSTREWHHPLGHARRCSVSGIDLGVDDNQFHESIS